MKKLIFVTIALSVASFAAQQCDSSIRKTTPDIRFVKDDVKGIAYDTYTGLKWYRCPLGKFWNKDKKTCAGTNEKNTFGTALVKVKDFNLDPKNTTSIQTWRIPNAKEMSSILEDACLKPALNQNIFVNFIQGEGHEVENYMWTSTYYEGSNEVVYSTPYSNEIDVNGPDQTFGAMMVSD